MNYPKPKITNSEIDLKLGIKSSLPNATQAIVLSYLIWKCGDRKSKITYSKQNGNRLLLKDELSEKIIKLLKNSVEQFDEHAFISNILDNPLLKAQIEALIVGFELIWKLARFGFVDGSSFSAERTGGKRFEKIIFYTSNIDIFDLLVQSNEKEYMQFFYEILIKSKISNKVVFDSFRKLLTVFSETAIYKIKCDAGDLIFDNTGIYKSLDNNSVVDLSDIEENKGSSRILKSSITEGLNYYLTPGNGGFISDNSHSNDLSSYSERVENFLALTHIKVSFDDKNEIGIENLTNDSIPYPHNRIIFGAPGTGKSHLLEEESELFTKQPFVSTNIIQVHLANCTTKGDYIKLGSLYQDELKNMSVSQIAESYNKTNAYWIKKGATYGLPTIIKDEELPEDIEDTLKSIPHGKQETESMKIGYEYCNYFDGKPIDEIKNLYQCSSTVASWISYGAEAAMSQVGTVEKPIKFLERVTFHPNYSYAQFVGTYKPIKSKENANEITYEYVPGPFMRVYANAVKNKNTDRKFLLLIEEINRANVAAVFGDVFQLLDRKADGTSQYPITASEDQKNYLKSCGINEDEISIPANMYIWATMNSADQGVLPMDAAFKRRWDFEYIGIDENEGEVDKIEIPIPPKKINEKTIYNKVKWNDLRIAINNKLSTMGINEDKLLGPFFISKNVLEKVSKAKDDNVLKKVSDAKDDEEKIYDNFVKLFKSKVLMYLYEDVVKINPKDLFSGIKSESHLRYSTICNAFDEKGADIFGDKFISNSGNNPNSE